MKKSLESKIESYCKCSEFPFQVYYTDSPINIHDGYQGQKYFFVYHGTHKIAKSFRTQAELEEFLNEELEC